MSHSREEVLSLLRQAEVAAVATVAGEQVRTRMMHFAVDDDLCVYLATMKGDPKTLQMTHHPTLSLLIYFPAPEFNNAQEIEYTGAVRFVRDPQERQKALELTAQKSPVVKYLLSTGSADVLDCIKIEPQLVKLRVFSEIVQGMPPTVIEFPEAARAVNEWGLLWRKMVNWYRELRPAFLTAALIPVLLGSAIAFAQQGGTLRWGYFALTLLAGLLIHAGANAINDYFDHKSGNDEINREVVRPFSGGSRLIQLGLLSPVEVLGIALFCLLTSAAIGLYLAWARGPLLLALGAVGLLCAFFYTGRPFYWAKRGVGELLVGLNFGPLMALGAYYVQTQTFSWLPVLAALPVGLLIAAVLYINEFPDYAADKAVGKTTWVVRLGLQRAVFLFAIVMGAAYLAVILGIALGYLPQIALIALATLPASVLAIRYAAAHYSQSFDLAPANALTITGHLAVGLALTWAFAWQGAGQAGGSTMVILGAAFLSFVVYMYWHVERQKRIFHGLKGVVAQK
ncbi:MAG: prenyltransferase [Chloroflexota bacterium]|nr:prenyltransferase [Chloroflexota bacterium]